MENQNINNQDVSANISANVNFNYNNQNQKLKADMTVKKNKYKYRVQDFRGKVSWGYLDAYNQSEVVSYLQNEGYKVLKIEVQNSFLNASIGGVKLSYSELAFMLTQLSTYLKAGIPLIDAIRILEKQSVKPDKKRIYSNIIIITQQKA